MFFPRVVWPALGLALLAAGCQSRPADRLWVEAKVNGRDVTMAVDTCSSRSFLFKPAAERLGLQYSDAKPDWRLPPGSVSLGSTEPCSLEFWGSTMRLPLAVAVSPSYVDFGMDGMVGWPEMRDRVFRIDASVEKIFPLDQLPDDIGSWVKFPFISNASILVLVAQRANGELGVIFVDTGSAFGVGLGADAWREWRAAHAEEPRTLRAYYTPGAGVVTGEVAWARDLQLGQLSISEVPVEEADPVTPMIVQGRHIATFGLAALKRLDFIIDGKNHVAYLRPKHTPPEPYDHNRLGAVFAPVDKTSEILTARVIPNTPAYEAGLRDGDMLISINGYPAGHWSSARGIGVPDFVLPERTNLIFIYARNGQRHRAHAWLADIIGPGSPGYGAK